jgi:hypothetical protein
MFKLTVYVPDTHVEKVKAALFAAGAGHYANYDYCSWQVLGQGQFRPLQGSQPFLGEAGRVEQVAEWRVEMIVPEESAPAVLRALRAAHPYEEPAYDLVKFFTLRDRLPPG